MNIKQHIEAGHYPKDEKGRPLVPHINGGTATILATDFLGNGIVGWITHNGSVDCLTHWTRDADRFLLPPPPRKRTVTSWAHVDLCTGRIMRTATLLVDTGSWIRGDGCAVVELVGSYEEPWS